MTNHMTAYANMASAYKRAKHFCDIEFDGEFSPLRTTQQNFALMIDRDDRDFLQELIVLDLWAKQINKLCDTRKIANDGDEKCGMAAYLSHMWIDPVKLCHG